eukprot:4775307-Pyramimonas_sp.AAC.1
MSRRSRSGRETNATSLDRRCPVLSLRGVHVRSTHNPVAVGFSGPTARVSPCTRLAESTPIGCLRAFPVRFGCSAAPPASE